MSLRSDISNLHGQEKRVARAKAAKAAKAAQTREAKNIFMAGQLRADQRYQANAAHNVKRAVRGGLRAANRIEKKIDPFR